MPSLCFLHDAFCVPLAGIDFPLQDECLPPTFGGCRDAVSHYLSPLLGLHSLLSCFRRSISCLLRYFRSADCVSAPHSCASLAASYCRPRQLLHFWWISPTLTVRCVHVLISEFSAGVSHANLSLCYCTPNSKLHLMRVTSAIFSGAATLQCSSVPFRAFQLCARYFLFQGRWRLEPRNEYYDLGQLRVRSPCQLLQTRFFFASYLAVHGDKDIV